MNLSAPDYQTLYKIQDEVFAVLKEELKGFYLTGGTALGRFYLNHRYSEDLDFFTNADPEFAGKVNRIYRKLKVSMDLDDSSTLLTDTYARMFVKYPQTLKIDVVNDVQERWGSCIDWNGIAIDNPANILSNKLGAILNRDEPKDIYDIISLSEAYSFNWKEVFLQTIKKQIADITDISMRISSFPVEWLVNQHWLKIQTNPDGSSARLQTIADDILFIRDNSLGLDKPELVKADISIRNNT